MQVRLLSVLAFEFGVDAVGRGADVSAVDQEPLFAALHRDRELFDWRVWDRFEGGPDAAPDRVDAADHLDVDQAVQVGGQVGQLGGGGPEVDGTRQCFV